MKKIAIGVVVVGLLITAYVAQLVVLAALLTACGGSTAPEPTPVAPPVKPAIHAHLYGDSTQAWNPHTGLVESLPAGSTVRVSAWPGLTAIQHLNGVSSIGVPQFQWSVANCNCDTVVVNYGINDAAKLAVSPDTYYGWMTQMRSIAEANGKKFIWQTPNPVTHYSAPLLAAYTGKADGQVADVYNAFIQYGNWWDLMADALHPNAAGYALATKTLAKTLTE